LKFYVVFFIALKKRNWTKTSLSTILGRNQEFISMFQFFWFIIYFVNVHVESSGFIPWEKSMVIVNLRTLRFVVMAHVTATTTWFPVEKNVFIF
jgi:hypothetical protein